MSRYIALTTKGSAVHAAARRVRAGGFDLGVMKPRVVKSPQRHGQTRLAVPEPRIVEFYAH